MSEEIRQYKSFLKLLAENPYDEATHKVFADWCEERGLDDEAEYHRTWTKEKQEIEDAKNEVVDKEDYRDFRDYNQTRGGRWGCSC